MAAFSYQHAHQPFLFDSIFFPNTPSKLSGFMEEAATANNDNINIFHHSSECSYPSEPLTQEFPSDSRVVESSCTNIDHSSSKIALSDNENEASVGKKQSTESSTVVDKLEIGEQVTQKVTPLDKKRKTRIGSSLNSAQSKATREYKEKKPRKLDGAKKAEEKKIKSDKKEQVKVAEEPPTGYIHVRARRGQATDSHSLAERVRREKISERMKMLQRLVPGCDKVTGRAVMLDEIINYVQSLQNQVEFLSMKLASVNPLFYDFGMDLSAFMVKPELQRFSSSMASPFPSVPQCSPTEPTHFADTSNAAATATTTTTTFSTANNYPFLDSSASLQFQQGQRPNAFSQDSESLLWDVEDQRQTFLNPSGFSNNLCSFN